MSLLKKSLEAFRTHQLNKRLGKAISEQNLDDMRQVLEEGAKAVHIVYYTSTPYGAMPTEEITDPLVFAQKVGLNEEGMALLKNHFHQDKPINPKKQTMQTNIMLNTKKQKQQQR